jgi:hypothetical protein
MIYELDSSTKTFKTQLKAFVHDTGWQGIFKVNVTKANSPMPKDVMLGILGEDSLGVTKSGQLVRIYFDGKTCRIET